MTEASAPTRGGGERGGAAAGRTGPDPTEAPPAPAAEVLAFWEPPPVGHRWDAAMDADGRVAAVRYGAPNQPNVIARLCVVRGSWQYSTYAAPDGTTGCSRSR